MNVFVIVDRNIWNVTHLSFFAKLNEFLCRDILYIYTKNWINITNKMIRFLRVWCRTALFLCVLCRIWPYCYVFILSTIDYAKKEMLSYIIYIFSFTNSHCYIYIYIYSFKLGKMLGLFSLIKPYKWVLSRLLGLQVD